MSSDPLDSAEGTHNSSQPSYPVFGQNIQSTLTAVCIAAVELVGVNHSGMVLFDEAGQWGKVVAEYPPLPDPAVGKTIQVSGVSAEEKLAHDGEPLVVRDVEGQKSLGPVRDLLVQLRVKSMVVVPIIVDNVIRGSFSFDAMDEIRDFRKEEIEKCKKLAHFASVVVKNAYLMRDLEALGDAVLTITSENDPEGLLQEIIRQAVTLLRAKGGGIHEYNPMRRELRIISAYKPPSDLVGKTLGLGEGMAGKLIESGQDYIAVPDYSVWEGRAKIFEGKRELEAVLGVPLRWKESTIGVLWVHNRRGYTFQKDEIELLQRFAATASITIAQSRLSKSALYKAERLQSLATATKEIITGLGVSNRDERLRRVAKHAHTIINAEAGAVFLSEVESELTLVASDGHRKGGFQKGRKFKVQTGEGMGLTGHIAFMKQPFSKCGKELFEHPAAASQLDDFTRSGRCYSLLAIPLRKESGPRGDLLGLLKISNKRGADGEPHEWTCFTEDDQSIAEIFAQVAVVAIETADLFDEIKRERERYQNLVDVHNVIMGAESLEIGLDRLAHMLLSILKKSFCGILLAGENSKLLQVTAVAKRPCAAQEFRWNPRKGEKTPINSWERLEPSIEKGASSVLDYSNEEDKRTLDELAKWIQLRNHEDEPRRIQCLLVVPLKIDDRLVGLLTVGELRDREGEGFGEGQVASAQVIATQASVLIDKNWQERRRERRRQLYERLEKAIQVIGSEPTTGKILLAIVREAAALFSAETAFLVLERPSSKFVRLVDSNGVECDTAYARLADVGTGFRNILNTREARIILESDEVRAEISLLGYSLNMLLAVPVSFAASKFILFIGDSSEDSGISRADIDILERLGQQGAISLSKVLVSEQLTRARDGAHRIAESMALGRLGDALDKVVNGIKDVIDCGAVTLYRFNPARNYFFFPPAMAGVWDKSADYLREVSEHAPTWKILRLGKLYVAHEAQGDPVMDCTFVSREQIKSSAGIPLVVNDEERGERKIGVMFVNYREPHRFSDEDEKNIKLFAHEAAVVIRNMELYEGLNEERARLKALYETERAINSSADLKTIFGVIAEQTYEVAAANGRRVNVADIKLREDDMVRLIAGYPEQHLAKIRDYVGEGFDLRAQSAGRIGIVGRVIQSGLAQMENDIENNPDFIPLIPGTRAQLAVPIQDDEGTTIGALSVESVDVNTFDEHDKEVMETLARQASVVVTKDRQRRLSANAKAMALVGAAGTIWKHTIKNLAASIINDLRNFERTAPANLTEVAARYLLSARHGAEEIRQSPSTVPLLTHEGVTNQLLNPMLESRIEDKRGDRRFAVDIEYDLWETAAQSVEVSDHWFKHAFSLILDNAVNAAQEGRHRKVIVQTEMLSMRQCLIKVENTGPKIADEIWERLGNEPIHGRDSAGRMGIGILLADMILGVYGGKWQKLANEEDEIRMGILMPVSGAAGAEGVTG